MRSYVLTRSYDDIDELCADARDWDTHFIPTSSGNFRSWLFQARSGAVEMSRGRFLGPLLQTGAPPLGHWTFVVPASPTVRFLWRGHRVRGDSILVFPLNGELHSVSDRDFDVFTIAVEDAHLQAVADVLVDRIGRALQRFEREFGHPAALVVAGGVAANKRLRQVLQELCTRREWRWIAPPPSLCTDNAAMIAWAGLEHFRLGVTLPDAGIKPRWPLDPTANRVIGGGRKGAKS